MTIPESSLGSLLHSKLSDQPRRELNSEMRTIVVAGLQSLAKKPNDDLADILPGLDEELRQALDQAATAERTERVAKLATIIRNSSNLLNADTMIAVQKLRELRAQLASMQSRLKRLKQIKESAAEGNVIDLLVFAYPELTGDLIEAELLGGLGKSATSDAKAAPATKKTARK